MQSRRTFLAQAALALTGAALPAEAAALLDNLARQTTPPADASDEDFWAWVKASFTVSPNILNLNNGGVSPQPKTVQEALERFNALSNESPSYYMWRVLDQGREPLRQRLAALAGCSAECLAICRNTTEALSNVIFGLDLKRGDEVVLSRMDYPAMINAWKQRELRDGIVLKWVELQLPQQEDAYFEKAYSAAVSSRTRVMHLTHLINWTGQVLPVAKMASAARARGIICIADIAHSFAHLEFKIPELNCHYAGTSLHKWLNAPFGTGMLYAEAGSIAELWPLNPAPDPRSADIRKFEHLGTRSIGTEMAIGTALDFHLGIGTARKNARLAELRKYWTDGVKDQSRVRFLTPLGYHPNALCTIAIDGLTPTEIDAKLWAKRKIHCSATNWESVHGVRITPSIYHSPADLDRLIDGIIEICSE